MGGARGFVDVRSPEEFRGEKLAPDHLPQEQSQVPGHIAGAANIPWAKAANDDGTFKSADELRGLYEAEGITADREVIAYCRIGERSSHTWFALQELLGLRTRQELRRIVDRVRLAGRGAGGVGRVTSLGDAGGGDRQASAPCASPAGASGPSAGTPRARLTAPPIARPRPNPPATSSGL